MAATLTPREGVGWFQVESVPLTANTVEKKSVEARERTPSAEPAKIHGNEIEGSSSWNGLGKFWNEQYRSHSLIARGYFLLNKAYKD